MNYFPGKMKKKEKKKKTNVICWLAWNSFDLSFQGIKKQKIKKQRGWSVEEKNWRTILKF